MTDHDTFVELWTEVLGLASADDNQNFFDCGGDSLLAVRLMSRARERGLVVRAADLFTLQDLGAIRARLARADDPGPRSIPADQATHALLPAQRRWVDGPLVDPDHFNLGWLFYAAPDLSRARLERAVTRVLERNEALRTAYEVDAAGGWRARVVRPDAAIALGDAELPDTRDAAQMAAAIARAHASMSLAEGRVFRVVHLPRTDQPGRLLVLAHHLTLDGFSLSVLADDLEAALGHGDDAATAALSTATPREYERAIQLWVAGAEAAQDADAWRRLPWGSLAPLPAASRGPALLPTVHTETGSVSHDETRALAHVARSAGVGLDMLVLAAAVGAIAEWSAQPVHGVDVYHHGRDLPPGGVNVTRTVGYVQTTFPVLLRWDGARDAWVGGLAEQLRSVPSRRFGFDALRYAGVGAAGELGGLPRLRLRYNFRGHFGRVNQRGDRQLRPAPESLGRHRSARQSERYLLMLEGDLLQSGLQFGIKFSHDHYDHETVSGLVDRTLTHLRHAARLTPLGATSQCLGQ